MSETAQVNIQRVTDTLYAPVRYTGSGVPEGVVTSEVGWMYRDTNNGLLWFKKTGSAATGWKAMGGTLFSNATTVGNTTSGSFTMQTNSIYAGTLAVDTDCIVVRYSGTFTSGGFVLIIPRLNGNQLNTRALIPSANGYFTVDIQIFRVSATSVRVVCTTSFAFDGVVAVITSTTVTTIAGLTLDTVALTLDLLGVPVSATPNNVTKLTGWAKLEPAP